MDIKNIRQIRQGDVWIEVVDGSVVTANHKKEKREGGRVILAHGEVTGHAHAIRAAGVCTLRADGSEYERLLIAGKTDALLQHEEHTMMPIGGGSTSVVRIQQEYDFLEEVARAVAD